MGKMIKKNINFNNYKLRWLLSYMCIRIKKILCMYLIRLKWN